MDIPDYVTVWTTGSSVGVINGSQPTTLACPAMLQIPPGIGPLYALFAAGTGTSASDACTLSWVSYDGSGWSGNQPVSTGKGATFSSLGCMPALAWADLPDDKLTRTLLIGWLGAVSGSSSQAQICIAFAQVPRLPRPGAEAEGSALTNPFTSIVALGYAPPDPNPNALSVPVITALSGVSMIAFNGYLWIFYLIPGGTDLGVARLVLPENLSTLTTNSPLVLQYAGPISSYNSSGITPQSNQAPCVVMAAGKPYLFYGGESSGNIHIAWYDAESDTFKGNSDINVDRVTDWITPATLHTPAAVNLGGAANLPYEGGLLLYASQGDKDLMQAFWSLTPKGTDSRGNVNTGYLDDGGASNTNSGVGATLYLEPKEAMLNVVAGFSCGKSNDLYYTVAGVNLKQAIG